MYGVHMCEFSIHIHVMYICKHIYTHIYVYMYVRSAHVRIFPKKGSLIKGQLSCGKLHTGSPRTDTYTKYINVYIATEWR